MWQGHINYWFIMLSSKFCRAITRHNFVSKIWATRVRNFSESNKPQRIVACKESEVTDGMMRAVQVGPNPDNVILLAEVNSGLYAVGGKCSHYGAPLHMGFMNGYNVMCPWHAAEFDVRNGEMTTSPGIKSIPKYKVGVVNKEVVIEVPNDKKDNVAQYINNRRMVKRDPNNETHFVIVGGGTAGHMAAETLRIEGFTGKITILSKENHLAYDRVLLSKNFDASVDDILLRKQDFYDEFGIEFRKQAEVKMIVPDQKQVVLENGEQIPYDKLLLASGSVARVPPQVQDAVANIKNVVTIRNAEDHKKIKESLPTAKDIVIIGGSFLGLEAATSLRRKLPDANITIVEFDPKPLERIFAHDIANLLIQTQISKGNRVIVGVSAKSINQENGKVKSVTIPTQTGEEEIKADLVLVATGAQIVTDYIPPSLLNPKDKSVRVNELLQTSDPNIYACGDIASFHSELTNSYERIEHWQVAQTQGMRAASNMAGKRHEYDDLPFFWSNQWLNVQFVGFGAGKDWSFTETKNDPDLFKVGKITYYFKGDNCIGAAVCNWPGAILRLRIALAKGFMPSKNDFIKGEANFNTISEKAKENACSHCADYIGNDNDAWTIL
ncbi:unnamed protein product [Blepharisma stoltei]|uniref:Rieske domain-containing protein n=1 Tax=Blepharisma stoltei TaxID=1481888 RepID=A0AAU9JXH6_9CILI|nr:unnamed protein product [Blepharisma stoltei]